MRIIYKEPANAEPCLSCPGLTCDGTQRFSDAISIDMSERLRFRGTEAEELVALLLFPILPALQICR